MPWPNPKQQPRADFCRNFRGNEVCCVDRRFLIGAFEAERAVCCALVQFLDEANNFHDAAPVNTCCSPMPIRLPRTLLGDARIRGSRVVTWIPPARAQFAAAA